MVTNVSIIRQLYRMEIPAIRGRHFWLSVLIVFAAALASCGQEAADIAVVFHLMH